MPGCTPRFHKSIVPSPLMLELIATLDLSSIYPLKGFPTVVHDIILLILIWYAAVHMLQWYVVFFLLYNAQFFGN